MLITQVENLIAEAINDDLGIDHNTECVDRITDLHFQDHGPQLAFGRIVFHVGVPSGIMDRIKQSDTWQIHHIAAVEDDNIAVELIEIDN